MRQAAWVIAFVVVVLAACGSKRPLPAPVIPPIDDHLIVPGSRVGPISLGMSQAQLLAAVGAPDESHDSGGKTQYIFAARGLFVWVKDGVVEQVGPRGVAAGTYATAGGLHVGSSELEVEVGLGKPSWKGVQNVVVSYCYDDATDVEVGGNSSDTPGRVVSIDVGGCNP